MIPQTIEEVIPAFDKLLNEKDKQDLINSKEDDLITYHNDLGRYIRNNWGLWTKGTLFVVMSELGFTHPDDMSQSLIREYWNVKNGHPSMLMEDMQKYKEYWERNK